MANQNQLYRNAIQARVEKVGTLIRGNEGNITDPAFVRDKRAEYQEFAPLRRDSLVNNQPISQGGPLSGGLVDRYPVNININHKYRSDWLRRTRGVMDTKLLDRDTHWDGGGWINEQYPFSLARTLNNAVYDLVGIEPGSHIRDSQYQQFAEDFQMPHEAAMIGNPDILAQALSIADDMGHAAANEDMAEHGGTEFVTYETMYPKPFPPLPHDYQAYLPGGSKFQPYRHEGKRKFEEEEES